MSLENDWTEITENTILLMNQSKPTATQEKSLTAKTNHDGARPYRRRLGYFPYLTF